MRARRIPLVRAGSLFALVLLAAGCTKGGQFDPTSLLDNDMFSSKKPLQGQREPVFPNGVPGETSGIPPDLYKGYQPPPEQAADNGDAGAAAVPPAAKAEAEAKPKPKPKPKPKVARAPATAPTASISVGPGKRSAPPPQTSQTAWPASSSSAQPAQSPWPSPSAQPTQSAWPSANTTAQ